MNSKQLKQLIKEQFTKALLEKQKGAQKTDISLEGEPYKLVLDVNRNPTKKGIKVQFQPLEIEDTGEIGVDTDLTSTQQRDLQIKILRQLNDGLRKYDLEADIDPDVPYKNVIGYYIHLQYFDKIIRDALKGGSDGTTEEDTEQDNGENEEKA
jgi:hypothetical protein